MISTKGRYGLRVMIDLAQNDNGSYIPLKDIAERQSISKKYLEQIIPMLNTPELLQTNRGFQGGYRLAQPPENYTVGMILRLTEGSLAPVACLVQHPNTCDRADECPTLFIWEGLNKVITEYLDSITLQDIIDRQNESYSNNYII